MKETIEQRLTNPSQTPYSKGGPRFNRGGDISMAESGEGPMGVDEATRRIEIAARTGEEARRQASARDFLKAHEEDLNVDVKRVLKEVAGESETRGRPSDSKERKQTAKTGPAIWKNKAGDQPVIVREYLGKGPDRREYVSVEGSATGIPLDEIDFPEELSDPKTEVDQKGKELGRQAAGASGSTTGEGDSSSPRDNSQEENSEGEPQMDGFWTKLNSLLNNETVRGELEKAVPDLEKKGMEPLKEFIESLNPADIQGKIVKFAEIMTRDIRDGIRGKISPTKEINIPKINISDASRKVILEWLLERIISIPDSTPETPYKERFGSWYFGVNKSNLLEIARNNLPEYEKYFGTLDHVRDMAHEFNRSLRFGDSYKEFVTQNIRSHGLDFIRNEIAGVSTAVLLYEKISAVQVSKTKEWLNDGDIKAIESKVKTLFEQLVDDGTVKAGDRRLLDWEKERALRLARIFFAGTQRLAMYASYGDLPSNATTADRIGSLPYEYIARALVPWKMIAPRFYAGSGSGGSKRYMSMIFKEQDAKAGEFVDLFGINKRTVMMDTYGAVDPESHGWRSQMMFFGSTKIMDAELVDKNGQVILPSRSMSLLEYLNVEAEIFGGKTREDQEIGLGGGEIGEKNKGEFSRKISDIILGQRLNLTVLTRYNNFDSELKTKLWQKIAIIKPSTLVSLCPEIVGNRSVWEDMADKIYKAEMKRVLEDGKETNLTVDQLRGEREKFEGILKFTEQKNPWTEEQRVKIFEYMGMQDLDLSSVEKNELETIIKGGVRASQKKLANAKTAFTLVIDDAPVVHWSKTGEGMTGLADEDVIRLLISDQENIKKAWGEMIAQVESPQHVKPTVEHFAKAVQSIADVYGRKHAQTTIEPFVTAWIKMASTKEINLWYPGLQTISRLANKPTSEMEKFFRESFLSLNEEDRRNVLQVFSQSGILSDNPAEADKEGKNKRKTQLGLIMEKTRSTKKWSYLVIFRLIVSLLGPAFAAEFLKTLAPKEIKS
jgi:hypothetical protein